MVDKSQETTHFGFQTVAKEQKADMVAHVFHSVASKYDVMNDLMSFGIHRLWKRFTIDCSGVRRGQTVLDLAGGTGDLTAKFSRLVGETGKVVLADINESMLKMGREKLRNIGVIGNVEYVQANAEALPFPDNTFDCITISFGLRNVTDKDKALRSMYRVLKPGGRLLSVLEYKLKKVLLPCAAAYWLTGRERRRQLPLSGRIHPYASRSADACQDHGRCGARSCDLEEHDFRRVCASHRSQALMRRQFC